MSSAFDDVLAGFRLGESETLLRLASLDDFQRAQHALVAQTRSIERAVTALGTEIELEGSDSLDNPDSVLQ